MLTPREETPLWGTEGLAGLLLSSVRDFTGGTEAIQAVGPWAVVSGAVPAWLIFQILSSKSTLQKT